LALYGWPSQCRQLTAAVAERRRTPVITQRTAVLIDLRSGCGVFECVEACFLARIAGVLDPYALPNDVSLYLGDVPVGLGKDAPVLESG
jgi:hypothetical protein